MTTEACLAGDSVDIYYDDYLYDQPKISSAILDGHFIINGFYTKEDVDTFFVTINSEYHSIESINYINVTINN